MDIQNYLNHLYATSKGKPPRNSPKKPKIGFLEAQISALWNKIKSSVWLKTGKSYAWTYKKEIGCALLIGGGLLYLYQIWKNRPQKPIVQMKTSLSFAKLSISIPDQEKVHAKAMLVFCIDTSGSMKHDDRADDVKSSLKDLLDHAQIAIRNQGASILVRIVAFDKKAREILPTTHIIDDDESIEGLKNQINAIKSDGETSILSGLEMAVDNLAQIPHGYSKTVILLTDGDSNSEQRSRLARIQEVMLNANANLFAIGIGRGHNRDVLKEIVKNDALNFHGTYIDTTQVNGETIQTAIDKIYMGVIKQFTDMKLSCPSLPAGLWSFRGQVSNQQSEIPLEAINDKETIEGQLSINFKRIEEPIDLSAVTLELSYKDPNGRTGRIFLPWHSNSIIDPAIINKI